MRRNYFNQCDAAAQEALKFAYRTLMYASLASLTVTKLRCVTAAEDWWLESPDFERVQPQGRMNKWFKLLSLLLALQSANLKRAKYGNVRMRICLWQSNRTYVSDKLQTSQSGNNNTVVLLSLKNRE